MHRTGGIGIWARLVGVLVLLASRGLSGCDSDPPVPEPQPAPEIEDVTVFHFNVHQGGSDGVIDLVARRVENERPTVVSLNEICGGDCTFTHPTQGEKKLDYIFVDKRHFESDVRGGPRRG